MGMDFAAGVLPDLTGVDGRTGAGAGAGAGACAGEATGICARSLIPVQTKNAMTAIKIKIERDPTARELTLAPQDG